MVRTIIIGVFLLLGFISSLSAAGYTVNDVTGRTITFEKPVNRIILGEGRYITTFALFDRENPVERIVGMLNDLKRGNPKLIKELKVKFPAFNKIELFGEQNAESVSAEKILSLKPDLAIFGIQDHGPGAKNKELLDQLEAAGVKIVFIDFRMNPIKNTLPSLKMLGRILSNNNQLKNKNGADYISFYEQRLAHISTRLAAYKGPKPTAFLQAHVGRFDCCVGMANGMLGPYLEFAGAVNISARVSPGPTARHTMEFLLEQNPDVWIGTASGTKSEFEKGKSTIFLGSDSNKDKALQSIKRATASNAMQSLKAIKNGRAHGIWHNYYNSPLNIVAVESFAKWIHPTLFADLEPEQTMTDIYKNFLPFTSEGIYTVTLPVKVSEEQKVEEKN